MNTINSEYLYQEWNKAKGAYVIIENDLFTPIMKIAFKHRCMKKFEKLLLKGTVGCYSFYKECFHHIYVDLCKKGTHYLGICSLEEGIQILCDSTTPEWLK